MKQTVIASKREGIKKMKIVAKIMQFECKVFKLSLARCAPFNQPTRCSVQETEWI